MAVIFAVNLAAQNKCTVSGYIRDAATGETLIGAGVMVMITEVAASETRTSGKTSGTKTSAATPGSSAIGAMSAASASGTKSEEKASAATPGANASAATNDKSRANSRIIGAVTNEFGYYTITIPCGNIDLTYSYVGCSGCETKH